MNDRDDNGFNQSMNKKSAFLRLMQCFAVASVTIILVFILILGIESDLALDLIALFLIFSPLIIITLPLIGFWIYSFVKAVRRRTKTDKILFWFHMFDILLLAAIILLYNLPSQTCDADIMAEYYNGKNGVLMRNITDRYRNLLPDSTSLSYEIGEESYTNILSDKDAKELKRLLKSCGCIGIDVDNYPGEGYSTIRFRRIWLGMYSYRFYNRPLTITEQDSINQDECLIVYNDSIVFEYGGGAIGPQSFIGKKEFMEKLRNK